MSRVRRCSLVFSTVVAVFVVSVTAAGATPGDIDLSYAGGDGLSLTRPINSTIPGAATVKKAHLLPSGATIVTATSLGNIFVAKYTPAGVLDPSFASGGIYTRDVNNGSFDEPNALDVQTDGKIVVFGRSENAAFILRLSAAGVADTAFDGDGLLFHSEPGPTDYMPFDGGTVLANGDIVAAGTGLGHVAVLRYTSTGQPASGFGTGGRVDLAEAMGYELSVLEDSNSNLVIAGNDSGSGYRVIRLNSTGGYSNTFGGGDGVVDHASSGKGVAAGVDSSNRVLITGPNGSISEVLRFTSIGGLDPTFSAPDGIAEINVSGSGEEAFDLQMFGDKAFVGGQYSAGAGFIALFDATGALDTATFNSPSGFMDTSCALGLGSNPCGVRAIGVGALGQVAYGAMDEDANSTPILGVGKVTAAGAYDSAFNGTGRNFYQPTVPDGLSMASSNATAAGGLQFAGVGGPYNGESTVISRITGTGAPDTTLDGDGSVVLDVVPGTYDYVTDSVIDDLGRTYVTGTDLTPPADMYIARLTAAGAMDSSYGGGDGIFKIDLGDNADEFPTSIVLGSGGNVVVGGFEHVSATERRMFVAEVTSSGAIAAGFNGGAPKFSATPASAEAQGGELLRDVSGGLTFLYVVNQVANVQRLTSTGSFDPAFNSGAPAAFPALGTADNNTKPFGRLVDGSIIMASQILSGTNDIVISKIKPDGTLDAAFGVGGKTTISSAGSHNEYFPTFAIDGDGRIVVGAQTDSTPSYTQDLFTARLTPTGILDPSFGSVGTKPVQIPGPRTTGSINAMYAVGKRVLVTGTAIDYGQGGLSEYFSLALVGKDPPVTPVEPAPPEATPVAPPANTTCTPAKSKLAALKKKLKKQQKSLKKAKSSKAKKKLKKSIKSTKKSIVKAQATVKKVC